MLNICLVAKNSEVSVLVNEQESHTFPLPALRFTEQDAETFRGDPSPYGKRLFDALFPAGSPAQQAFRGLRTSERLILRMDDPRLAGVPWEYLHDGKRWLATHFALVRARIEDQTPVSRFGTGRARLLFVPAEPLLVRGVPQPYALGLDQEWDNLVGSLRELDAACDLVKVVPPTMNAVQRSLSRAGNNIVHFTGHGAQSGEDVVLMFEEPSGTGSEVPGSDFRLGVEGAVLVVLSACESAMEGTEEAANLSAALAAEGIPYVLGMQLSVPDTRAREFTTIFYENLFAGRNVPEAARRARFGLMDDPFVMGIPVLWAAEPNADDHLNAEEKGLRLFAPATQVNLTGVRKAASGFFGRQRELVQVGALLMPERPRRGQDYPPLTVTLKGAGGIGKTALLHKAAERFAWRFRDGVLGLSLEPLPSPAEVLARVEQFFGLPDGATLEPKARAEAVTEALTGRMALLALDNYESVLYARAGEDPAKKQDAALLHKFFETLPGRGLTLLVSSRALTRLPGEHEVPVSGLDDPSGAAVFRSRVQTRAGELDGKGSLLYTLSQRVGGHALALRLLGPVFDRSADPSLDAFVERLDMVLPEVAEIHNDGERHDTLEKCFAFSLDALPGEDETLRGAIARLSVFHGGFLDLTAEPVLFGWTEDEEKTREQRNAADQTLRALEERGLLERRERGVDGGTLQFYSVHQALRPFTAALLGPEEREQPEGDFWQAMNMLSYWAYPHEQEGRWVGIASEPWKVEAVRAALPDLLKAAGMRKDADGSVLRQQLAFCLRQFGDLYGAMKLYEEALEIKTSLGDRQGRAATLREMAYILSVRGEMDGAMKLYEEVLEIDNSLGNRQGRSVTLHEMAYILRVRSDLDGAMKLYEESLEIDNSLGNRRGRMVTLHQMAIIMMMRGDLDGAMKLYEESLETLHNLGDRQGRSVMLNEMANILMMRGDLDGAMKLYEESLEIKTSLGDRRGRSVTLHEMANILRMRGDLDGAMKLYEESLEIKTSLGDRQGRSATLHAMANILATRGDLDGAMRLYEESLEIKDSLGDRQGRAMTLAMMGQTLWYAGQREAGLRHLLEGFSLLVQLRIMPQSQQTMVEWLRGWRKEIGPEQFDPLWQKVTDEPPPDWLAQEEGSMMVEQWVQVTIRAARAKAPKCKDLFDLATNVQKDPNAPKEIRDLAAVLLKILAGNFAPDMSALTQEYADLVRETLAEGQGPPG